MDGQATRATETTKVLAEHDVREHGALPVDSLLSELSKNFPKKTDIQETYQEVASFLRSQDLPQRDVERLLRLLRRKCKRFISVSSALVKWSKLHA